MTRKVNPMQVFAWLRGIRRARSVTITHVTVTYRSAFPVRVALAHGHVQVDLAWSSRTETAFTDSGRVWSEVTVSGPAIDRVPVSGTDAPSPAVSDIVVTYPVRLGAELCSLVSTAPGSFALVETT
jgi:hypothetical protein